jgi:hypothetical protein
VSGMIDDIDECRIVVEQAIDKTNLADLVGPLAPDGESLCNLMQVNEGEEAEIDLVDEEGQIVVTLLVDVLDDPVNRWRIGLRGWRLCNHVASV